MLPSTGTGAAKSHARAAASSETQHPSPVTPLSAMGITHGWGQHCLPTC